jgi:DNA-directed RNA polymerase specialized sigma24 family protein
MHPESHGEGRPEPIPRPSRAEKLYLVLAGQAQAGDALALETLVRLHEPILRRILRVRNGAEFPGLEALDLVGRGLVPFAPSRTRPLRGHTGVVLWLAELLEECIRPQLGSRDARQSASGEQASVVIPELLDACVGGLERMERELVLLRDYVGASWAEIAQELDMPPQRARELHQRARINVARALARRSSG